jgi:hypothetical protein
LAAENERQLERGGYLKRWGYIAIAVIVAFGVIFLFVRKSSNLETSLAREDAILREVKEALDEMEGRLPDLTKTTEQARDSRLRAQQELAERGKLLKPEEARLLILANKSAGNDLELAVTNLTVAREIVANLVAIQGDLEANRADLRKVLLNGPQPRESADRLREGIVARCKRIDDLMKVCEMFTTDLNKFVLMEQQQWLDRTRQLNNLMAAAQGDPEFSERFKAIELLQSVSGIAIEHSRKVGQFLENVPKKQVDVEMSQQGFLSMLQ